MWSWDEVGLIKSFWLGRDGVCGVFAWPSWIWELTYEI